MKRSLDAHAVVFDTNKVLSILTPYYDREGKLYLILSIQKTVCYRPLIRLVYAVNNGTVWEVFVDKSEDAYARFYDTVDADFNYNVSVELFLSLRR
jgi:hypothetical protein